MTPSRWRAFLALGLLAVVGTAACNTTTSSGDGPWTHEDFAQWHHNMGATQLAAIGTQCYFCAPRNRSSMPVRPGDRDGDGVTDDKDQCPNSGLNEPVNERGCWELGDVRFKLGSAWLSPPYRQVLDRLVVWLADKPELRVAVLGHTDSSGPSDINDLLSWRRAKAVVDYLVVKGIDRDRILAHGYGEERPAFGNETRAGRESNRRVEIRPLR